MKASPIQTSFNSGEVSQLMTGRVDFDREKSSVGVCLNALVHVQGPWTRRPGFAMVDEVKDSTKPTRLVRFKYNTGQAYALEFGHFYMRVKKNRAPIYDETFIITDITSASPAVVTYSFTGVDPANGDDMDLSGIVAPMQELNGLRVRVANVNTIAKTFECVRMGGAPLDTTTLTYNFGGFAKRVFTLVTPYDSADIFQLKFTRQIDRMYVFHVDYPEATINRFSDSSWTHTPLVFLDGPYLPVNTTTTTLTPSAFAPGAGVTLTASAVAGINDGAGFQTTDIGRYIRIKEGSSWGYVLITGRTSTTVVTVTIINSLFNTAAKLLWRMGLLSDTTGYSSSGTFFGDRLYLGGVPYRPSRFDASKTADYQNMAETAIDGTTTDASAFNRTLQSEDVQRIRWMRGGSNGVIVGTSEGEWVVSSANFGEAITPTNVDPKESSSLGSADIEPLKVGVALAGVQAGARRLLELIYSYSDNLLLSEDLTVLSEHITKGPTKPTSGLVELAYQKERIPVVWAPRKDGVLLGATYSKGNKVIGWHRHIVGGWSNEGHTAAAQVKSCTSIPASDESYDELWAVTQRYIGGRVVQYNEFLTDLWEQGNAQVDAFFVDAGATYSGVPTQTIFGLHHLAGETIQCLVNGATHPNVTVSSLGVATLTTDALLLDTLTAHFGYGYNSDGQALRPEAGAADGTAQGKIQRTHNVTFRLHDTLGLEAGPSFQKLLLQTFRTSAMSTGAAPPLFNGDHEIKGWAGGYTKENLVCWRISQPLPGTVLCLMPQLLTEDR